MKSLKSLLVIATALVIGLTTGVAVQARSLDDIKKSGKIVFATEGAYPPFNYFEGAKLSGFEVELAEAMAKKMGLQIEWKTLAFDALLGGLAQNRFDVVIASFGITPERANAVDFTKPHYCSGGVIVSKDGKYTTGDSLAGKTIAVQTGTSYLENVQKLKGLKAVKNFPRDTDARNALATGRVDAWVTDKFVAKDAIAKAPNTGKIGGFLFVEKIAPTVQKGNTALAAAVDKALADVMADGTYKKISEKFFQEDIRCTQ